MSEVILAVSVCPTMVTEVYQSGSKTTVAANESGCESTSSTSKYLVEQHPYLYTERHGVGERRKAPAMPPSIT